MTQYRAIIYPADADFMGDDPLIIDSDNYRLWRESVRAVLKIDPKLIARKFKKINRHYEPLRSKQ